MHDLARSFLELGVPQITQTRHPGSSRCFGCRTLRSVVSKTSHVRHLGKFSGTTDWQFQHVPICTSTYISTLKLTLSTQKCIGGGTNKALRHVPHQNLIWWDILLLPADFHFKQTFRVNSFKLWVCKFCPYFGPIRSNKLSAAGWLCPPNPRPGAMTLDPSGGRAPITSLYARARHTLHRASPLLRTFCCLCKNGTE